jgi:DNA-binding transcriptional MerR regulator
MGGIIMKYSIGEFAHILGVSVDTLRLYEKHGIIKPIKDAKNNYRYFNDLDARNLLISRWYRSIQIPLHDVSALTRGSSMDNIIEKIREKRFSLQEEIKKSTMLLNKVTEINNDIENIQLTLNQCRKKEISGIYRLKQTNKNDLLKDEPLRGMVSTWMNLLPFTFYSFRIECKEFLSEGNCFDYTWGLAISEEEVHNFDIDINDYVEYIAPKTYISSVVMRANQQYLSRESFQFIIDYIKEHQYSITGDIIGRLMLVENINGLNRYYLEVNIPV